MNKWIKCSEQLPVEGFYNIYYLAKDFEGEDFNVVSSAAFKDGNWVDVACRKCGYIKYLVHIDVTHWQPLPRPPFD